MSKYKTRSGNKNGDQVQSNAINQQNENPFNLIDKDNPTMKDLYNILTDLVQSFNFLAESNDEFKTRIKQLEDENKSLKNETEQLHRRVQYIEADYYNEQQQKLQNHITLHGIPQQKPEEITNTVIKIGQILKVDITPLNIKSFRTMNNQNRTNSSPIIIVEFNELQMKHNIQQNYKNNGPIILSQLFNSNNNNNKDQQKVYLNDYLCSYVKSLLEQTKKIKEICKIKFVWTKNGCVYARYNEKSPIIKIKNYKNIADLEEEAKNN